MSFQSKSSTKGEATEKGKCNKRGVCAQIDTHTHTDCTCVTDEDYRVKIVCTEQAGLEGG